MRRHNGYLSWKTIYHVIICIEVQFKLSHSDCTTNLCVLLRILKYHASLTLFIVCVYYVVGLTPFNLSAKLVLIPLFLNYISLILVLLFHVVPAFQITVKVF